MSSNEGLDFPGQSLALLLIQAAGVVAEEWHSPFKTTYLEIMHKIPLSLRWAVLIFASLALVVLLSQNNQNARRLYADNPREQILTAAEYYKSFPEDKKTASKVELGLYIDNLYNFDLKTMSYKARGWLWYNWSTAPMLDGKVDPGQMGLFDFNFLDETSVNQVISSNQPVESISDSGDKSFWNETSFDAKLAAKSINLRKFPFDEQKLEILITNPVHFAGELAYLVQQFRLPDSNFNIPAYRMDGISFADQVRVYTSNFVNKSIVSLRDGSDVAQSQAAFIVSISRNPFTSLLEYVFPVTLVTFMAFTLVRLGKDYWHVKVQAPPAAMLSLVFLQNSFKQGLPQLAYLTCMDLIFLIAYLVCMLSFLDGFHLGLLSNADGYKGIYGKLAAGTFALSPLVVKAWLVFYS